MALFPDAHQYSSELCAKLGEWPAMSWDWVTFANSATAALIGTAVGATIVFWIDGTKRRQRIEDERVAATNVAIFNLANAWRALESFRKDRIEPVRAGAAWFRMKAGEITFVLPDLDATGLAFLFETSEPDLPAQVQFEFSRFEHIRLEIKNRTEIHVTQAQPRVEAALGAGKVDEQTLIASVGHRLYQTLSHQTDQIIRETGEALPSIYATAQRLRKAVKAEYPKRKIIRFEPTGTQPEKAEPAPAAAS
jgi:hypothetical protein